MRIHPIYKTEKMHNGIDIGFPSGTNILSVSDGEVISSSMAGTAGNQVVIRSPEGYTFYYMLDEIGKESYPQKCPIWLASPGGAGRNRVLNLKEMLEYEMVYPTAAEQAKIKNYFKELDNLITLHQCKFRKLNCYRILQKINDSVKNRHNKIDEFAGF